MSSNVTNPTNPTIHINGKQADPSCITPGNVQTLKQTIDFNAHVPPPQPVKTPQLPPLLPVINPIGFDTPVLPPPPVMPVKADNCLPPSDLPPPFPIASAPVSSSPTQSTNSPQQIEQDRRFALHLGLGEEAIHSQMLANRKSDPDEQKNAPPPSASAAIQKDQITLDFIKNLEAKGWIQGQVPTVDQKPKQGVDQKPQVSVRAASTVDLKSKNGVSHKIPDDLKAKIVEKQSEGYIYVAENEFLINPNTGHCLYHEDLKPLNQTQPQKQNPKPQKPLKELGQELLNLGYQEIDGTYYHAGKDGIVCLENIDIDDVDAVVQEVNAIAKSLGYFYDPSKGGKDFAGIYTNAQGQSVSLIKLYVEYVLNA